jgi:hypothetical protein
VDKGKNLITRNLVTCLSGLAWRGDKVVKSNWTIFLYIVSNPCVDMVTSFHKFRKLE